MSLDVYSLVHMLQSCNIHWSIHQGKQLQLLVLKKGLLGSDVNIGICLLQMYVRCDSIGDAHALFEEMPQRNCFSCNTMVEGYMKSGDCERSLELFKKMTEKNDFSWNTVISGFSKEGLLDTAQSLFGKMPRKSCVAWTAMIYGYAQYGQQKAALRLFKCLSSYPLEESCSDKFVLATIIGVCTDLDALGCGKQIHARILIDKVEMDSASTSSLINFYGKCGDLDSSNYVFNMTKEPDDYSMSALIVSYANFGRMDDARKFFDAKSNPSVALWSSIISGYVSDIDNVGALNLFNDMRASGVQRNSLTVVSVLSACGILGILLHAMQFHAHACKAGMIDNIVVASAFLDAYSKCGSLDDACKLFSELKALDRILLNCMISVFSNCGGFEEAKHIFKTMPRRSLISWNSVIIGLCQNGCPIYALGLFQEMNNLGLKMDKFSLASAISACAGISSLEFGEQIFARVMIGLEYDKVVSNSLLDFFCKCGLVENGQKIFDRVMRCDEVPWNAMLMVYATNGHGLEALALFDQMLKAGVVPNDITFTGVFSACDHCGLVEGGRKWFCLMICDYHIDPSIEHYACMIDLFSRAVCLEEAMNMIEKMPFKVDVSMLSSVLRGCMANGLKTLGTQVAERIIELDSEDSGAYVQLSKIFASYGDWEESAEVRKVMRRKGVQKILVAAAQIVDQKTLAVP